MKLNFVYEFKTNAMEVYFLVGFVIWLAFLLFGIFYDPIANALTWNHQAGYGIRQVLACAFCAVYLMWTFAFLKIWREK